MCIESRVPNFVSICSVTMQCKCFLAVDAAVEDWLLNVLSWFFQKVTSSIGRCSKTGLAGMRSVDL